MEVRIPGSDSTLVETVQPIHFTPEEVAKAEAAMVKRAGPVIVRLRERTAAIWELVLAELNQQSGGLASTRTTVLAHHALRAHTALELQTMLAEVSAGEDRDGSDRAFRSLAGLAVVATDLLNKAYEAAQAEGKAARQREGGPVGELMARMGVTPAHGESSEVDSPFDGGGGSTLGPPPSQSKPSRKQTP